jgi:hypothetical protein
MYAWSEIYLLNSTDVPRHTDREVNQKMPEM